MSIKISGNTPGGKFKFSGNGAGKSMKISTTGGGGGGGGAFDPLSIGDAICWFKADSGIYQSLSATGAVASVDGDRTGYWSDQSGQGNHAIASANDHRPALKVVGSKKGVHFEAGFVGPNGGGEPYYAGFLISNALNGRTQGGALTIIMAANAQTTYWNGNAYDSSLNASAISYPDTSQFRMGFDYNPGNPGHATIRLVSGGDGDPSQRRTIASGTDYVQSVVQSAASSYWDGTADNFVNGVQAEHIVGSSPPNYGARFDQFLATGNGYPFAIGSDGNSGYLGVIYEVLVYNKALSAGERASVEGYLQTKYGI